MPEIEIEVSAVQYKEQTPKTKVCRKAGYLDLTDSTFNRNEANDSGREVSDNAHEYATVDEETSAEGVRQSRFRRALLFIERRISKLFRGGRRPRMPAGLQHSSTEITGNTHVNMDTRLGNESPRYAKDGRLSRSFSNALAVREDHSRCETRCVPYYGARISQQLGSHVTYGQAPISRQQCSSRDRFGSALHVQIPREEERWICESNSQSSSVNPNQPSNSQRSEVPPAIPPRVSIPLVKSMVSAVQAAPVSPVNDQMMAKKRQTVYNDPPRPAWSGQDPLNCKEMMRQGWYWGPMKREHAVRELFGHPPGTFLVRDCGDERHLYALSIVAPDGTVKHILLHYCQGKWSFYRRMSGSQRSVVKLIERAQFRSSLGLPVFTWQHLQGVTTVLTKPLSRFTTVKPLQHYCRFAIRQYCRIDLIQQLPLPARVKEYLEEDMM